MEWIRTLNQAIDYMEDHLADDLTCEKIAEHVFISSFHFQRTFNLMTGMTIGEYIRNRRLSLAGQELTKEGAKVIDIALKYGYESPESFSKAFRRFHDATPLKARESGTNLKSFNRLVIKIKLEGGSIMDYKIVKKEAFEVVAKVRLFSAETNQKEIPEFWTEYYRAGLQNKVCGMLGICIAAKNGSKDWEYGIGCERRHVNDVPKDFQVIGIPAYTWAIFKCVGPMPGAIQDGWKKIYSEWLPQSSYEMISDCDIEMYAEGNNQAKDYESEIWIPVKEK